MIQFLDKDLGLLGNGLLCEKKRLGFSVDMFAFGKHNTEL